MRYGTSGIPGNGGISSPVLRRLQRFTNRVTVYLSLMDDRYPSIDDHQSVHLDYSYPDHLNGGCR